MSSMPTTVSAIANVLALAVFGSAAHILYRLVCSALGFSSQRQIIKAYSEAYSISLRVAMGVDKPAETQAQYIARLEHEMMIEGHQYECEICIENNMTLRQKAIRAMKERWNV